jgi:hypothetical protein
MKKYSTKKIIEDFFFNQLVSKTLYCASGCQGLERNNPEGDFAIKSAMVNYLYDNFSYLKSYQSKVDDASEEYYKGYKMMEISESNEYIHFIKPGKLSTIFEQINEANMGVVREPKGWKHFDKKRLSSEKIKLLKGFDILSTQEIVDFMNSMPNSRNVNDVLRKIKATRGVEDFLRFEVQDKSVTKKAIENMIKRGY